MDAYTRSVAQHWLDEERPAEVVVVIEAHGSVPRGIGTRMVISATEAVGTIGGGNLEHKAIIEALRSASPASMNAHSPPGPSRSRCSTCRCTAPAMSARRSRAY
jgi:xanthine dehydrogenase accessory factor